MVSVVVASVSARASVGGSMGESPKVEVVAGLDEREEEEEV